MSRGSFLLGIDIGGTGAKAGLFSLDGVLTQSGYSEYAMLSDVPGQAEHDAELWWRATVRAIKQAIGGVASGDILGVGVGGTNGLIAVDQEARPLRPAIMLWDQRTLPEVEHIKKTVDVEHVFEITGNPVAAGAYSLPIILWLKHHDPNCFAAAHKLMVPTGYVVARLTGEFTIDYSRACTTLLFDIRRHDWHTSFLEAFDIPLDKLPSPMPSQEIIGRITPGVAALTGLNTGTPVVAGCMDTIGASIGSGSMNPGDCFIIMGTAARVSATLSRPQFNRRFINCPHVLPERWLTIGAINGVGSSLRWVRDNFGQLEKEVAELTGRNVYDLITEQALQAPPGSKGLVFLPYMSGERVPIWDPYARGVFFGVTLGHRRQDFLRSVLEGTAFAIRHVVEALETDGDQAASDLRIGGAAAASGVWNQIIADVLGRKVVSLAQPQTEVLGAAMLAAVGVGVCPDYESVLERTVTLGQIYQPNDHAHDTYNHLFPIYKELYIDVKPYFERLANLGLPQIWVNSENISSL